VCVPAQEELKKQQRRERFNLPPTPEEQAKMDAAAKAATVKEIAEKKQVSGCVVGVICAASVSCDRQNPS